MRCALFVTCGNDALYPQTGRPVALLERLGHEAAFPADQTCCGPMHTGYEREGVPLVERSVKTFQNLRARPAHPRDLDHSGS